MQNGENNALELVSDYVLPAGLIDFETPAKMVLEYMKQVKEKPKDKEAKENLKAMAEGANAVVRLGMAQVEQGRMLVGLLEINKKLRLMK